METPPTVPANVGMVGGDVYSLFFCHAENLLQSQPENIILPAHHSGMSWGELAQRLAEWRILDGPGYVLGGAPTLEAIICNYLPVEFFGELYKGAMANFLLTQVAGITRYGCQE